jgi:hypothetical protein
LFLVAEEQKIYLVDIVIAPLVQSPWGELVGFDWQNVAFVRSFQGDDKPVGEQRQAQKR